MTVLRSARRAVSGRDIPEFGKATSDLASQRIASDRDCAKKHVRRDGTEYPSRRRRELNRSFADIGIEFSRI